MATLGVVAGLAIVGLIVFEVFTDLFRPAHSGALSDWIGRGVFNLSKRKPALLPAAGPLALAIVILTWILSLVVGFGLVYVGWFPEHFQTSTAQTPYGSPRVASAFYFSFETLITLGYGDLVPASTWLRFVAATEALIGFGLLTASVSAIVLIYPALARMRLLARSIAHAVRSEQTTGLSLADSGSATAFEGFAMEVARVRIDLVHFPIVYYFAAEDPDASVANWIPHLVRITKEAATPHHTAAVRLAAAALDSALSDLASLFGERFVDLRDTDRDVVLEAVRRDHLVTSRSTS